MNKIEPSRALAKPLSGLSGPAISLSLKEFSERFCQLCESLNKLGGQDAEIGAYIEKYEDLRSLERTLELLVSEYGPQSKPLERLILGIIDYYKASDFGNHRIITHAARWPEFKKLIEDEVSILTNAEVRSRSDKKSREASHAAILGIRYDRSNIARPWDTGPEQDLLSFHRQVVASCELKHLHGICKLFMNLKIPNLPYQSNGSGLWNDVFDQFWDKMTRLYYQHQNDPAYAPLADLIPIANFTRESLRTDCYPIQALAIEIADLFLTKLQKPEQTSQISNNQLSKALRQLKQAVYELETEFSEHKEFKQKAFNETEFEKAFTKIKDLAKVVTTGIALQDQSVTVEIPLSVFRAQKEFDNFFEQLAVIEASRVDSSARNSLKVAYGPEEIRELSERRNSCLLVHFRGKEPVGFVLAELHSPDMPDALKPLLEEAINARGKVPYAYLHLVAVKKQSSSAAYRQLMESLDNNAVLNGMVYTLGWCRQNNAANIIHLKTGGEMLPGYVRITEHGQTMVGIPLLRKSVRRGIQGLIHVGETQASAMRKKLAEKVS